MMSPAMPPYLLMATVIVYAHQSAQRLNVLISVEADRRVRTKRRRSFGQMNAELGETVIGGR